MEKNRLEAFSDGVLAIIIIIMVLEIKVPHGTEWSDLEPLLPVFLSYIFSFVYVGIYWGNHHHLLYTVKKVSSGIMLANLNLLFWLSLLPFATGWMGENYFEPRTVTLYALLLNMCGVAYTILQKMIEKCQDFSPEMKLVMKKQTRKGLFSVACYTLAVPFAYVNAIISVVLFLIVAIAWLVPDKNIERALNDTKEEK